MSNQIQITGGAKVRSLEGVITGTTGVLSSLPINGSGGIPQLDVNGKILVSQLPNSVMEYKGTWDASTNTPTLANGTGNTGDVYLCSVAGTVNFGDGPISFVVSDQVIYSGTIWQKASGTNGTVTSIAVTESGDALIITGSPVTTSGTINIGFAGTSAQYVAGNGSLITFPTLTGYVPYTGATANVDLGEYELKAGQLSLDVSPTGTASVGTTRWNNTIGSSETTLKGGTVILKNGVDLVVRVVNKVTPNTTLTKADYAAVRVSGAQGQRLAVAYAQANDDNNSADTLGLVIETIATNQEGFIMTVGQLEGVDTTGSLQGETWADGDVLYLSPTTPGALTNIKPTGLTGHIVVMGYVEYSHANNGKIYVKIMNGWELDELHNVYISSPTNNQGLFYNSSNSLWENKSIATALGYTPANDSLVVHLAGTETITGNKTFSNATKNNGGILLENNSSFSASGYMNLGGMPDGLRFTSGLGISNFFALPSATGYTFTFPNASGTLALTSDLNSYVPYTGATTSLNMGSNSISSTYYTSQGDGTNAGSVILKQRFAASGAPSGYSSISAFGDTTFLFSLNDGTTNRKFYFSSYLLGSTSRTYILPNADGTLALTTDLGSYLPLSGGTLTGALNGTSASFSSSVQATDLRYTNSGYLSYDTSNSGTGTFTIRTGAGYTPLILSNSGAATFSSSVSINTTNAVSTLEIGAVESDGTGSANAFRIQSKTGASNQQLLIGINQTGTYSFLQSSQASVGYKPLALNPNGGNVGIGTSSPSAALNVVTTAAVTAIFTRDLATDATLRMVLDNVK